MSDPLAWLLVIELMGLLGFPLAFFLCASLPDRGYCLGKALALLLAAYLLWVIGLTGVAPNSPLTIAAILLAGAVAFGWLYYRRWPELEEYLRANWRYVLVVEGLFLAVFLAWVLVVSSAPAINHTEKPMDFAFLTSIWQSSSFPPEDPWLAGHSISYYYFGHFVMALPLKLAGITSNVGYNLALATLPALVAAASFGIVYNLIRLAGGGFRAGIWFALAAPLLITVAGNLEGVLEFIQVRGWGGDGFWQWVAIKGLDGAPGSGLFPDGNWWWWRATRVIDTLDGAASLDYTITEFPFFSFLLGDLHSHVLSLPFALLALGLTLNLFRSPEPVGPGRLLRRPGESAALSLSFGALAFVNSWDFPVYAAILGGVTLIKAWGDARASSGADFGPASSTPSTPSTIEAGRGDLGRAFLAAAFYLVPLLAAAVLLFLPFYVTLTSQVSGILPHLGPGTQPLHFLLVMGLPALLGLALLWRQMYGLGRPTAGDAPSIALVVIVAVAPLLLWLLLAATWGVATQDIQSLPATLAGRTLAVLPGLAVVGLAGYCALSRAGQNRQSFLAFPLLLLAAAAFLLAGAELYHLADFFGNRMNTVFKVYYQAWLLLGIVGAFGIYYCCSRFRSLGLAGKLVQSAWAGIAATLLIAALYYPMGAILDRAGWFSEGHDFKNNTLDGLDYIRDTNRAEYAAIRWLRDQAKPGYLVEAVGDGYSEYGRVSAATGRPALLGWPGHERQWRGSTEAFAGREEHVAQIYQGEDPLAVYRLLAYYDVRYVYLGHRERAKYGRGQSATLDGLLETVFAMDDVVIYERLSADMPLNE